MKNKLWLRQFYHEHHVLFNYYFLNMTNEKSTYKDGPDLFGGSQYLGTYTTSFNLELIYG